MANAEYFPGSTTSIFPIGESEPEPEVPDHLQSLNSISQWCDYVLSYDDAKDLDCNPFAPPSSGGEWLADSDSDRDMSCFVTDLFERGDQSSEHEPIETEGLDFGGLRIADFESESDCEEIRPDERLSAFEQFDWEEMEESESRAIPIEAEEIETMLDAVESFEWEIMMAINTLASNASLERDGGGATAGAPAAKGFVESLLVVSPEAADELGREGGACAVCKDRISASGGAVNKLPCNHYFHSDCIVPWLGIRNTCPVCRFEVPTDDPRKIVTRSRNPHHQVFSEFEFFS